MANGILQRLEAYRHFARDLARLGRHADEATPPPNRLRVRIRGGPGAPNDLERTGELTPYELETIAEDARRARAGWSLDVHLDDGDPLLLDRTRHVFATLGALGVRVHLIRHPRRR